MTGSQKGSILVGVMALSIAMTLVAGRFLLVTANIAPQVTGETSKQQLLFAAETGIYMGINWTRNYPALKVKDPNWIAPPKLPLTLTTAPDGFDQINGYKVKVNIETTPPAM